LFERTYSEQIKQAERCKSNHQVAESIVEKIRRGFNDKVREAVTSLNKVFVSEGKTVKTVIGIDATGSMSAALGQVLSNTKICLERTYQIL